MFCIFFRKKVIFTEIAAKYENKYGKHDFISLKTSRSNAFKNREDRICYYKYLNDKSGLDLFHALANTTNVGLCADGLIK